MKKYIYFLLILLAFSCTKDQVEPSFLPIGYYDVTCIYDNGIDIRTGVLKFIKSDSQIIVIDKNNYVTYDTLVVNLRNITGNINLSSSGTYKIDGDWTYSKKTKDYVLKGKFSKIGYGMGGSLIFYYYGTFEMKKAE